ncbi:MAG: hypothetical protein A3D74_05315 [Candidatus Levybacteria bacterium RIFCSPHIGHO2_02_FULL_37_13]|nr:MAG: hypothetical protein A3D74_05315 [Candidatus Levybacteria bacterium RIFCSPHIGHO2_02_FULL_37_13]OGH29931.1 MAG: hypothetical protein A3E40_04565 [Candidatus Levybacteria bacterium RIFCSPHIGHO2_12_FULL_37_9]OGH39740.1 MAG: hypothetical protein A3B41_00815 [Candidatus Levybacteria bacterium RIFCSPLOWO2_01_FULL_37_26]
MKKILTLISILIVTSIAFISLKYLENNNNSKIPTAIINNHTFKLDLAKTQQEKAIGLSKKDMLEKNAGMLFMFEKPSNLSFWMKDMKFPIDIIFIKNNRIVTIHKNVMPPGNSNDMLPTYSSKQPADTVLEINAGLSEKYNFKENDLVRLDNI